MKQYLTFLLCVVTSFNLEANDATSSNAVLSSAEASEVMKLYAARPLQEWKSSYGDITKEPNYKQLEYAVALLSNTVGTIGPKVQDPKMRYSANSLNCTSCHLNGESNLPGTKKFAAPFTNVMNDYPKFEARSMKVESIAERVNGCMTRSQGNGKPLPLESKEMKSLIAYFKFLAKGTQPHSAMKGTGLQKVAFPDRKASVKEGKDLYSIYCMECHQKDAVGLRSATYTKDASYNFTPLAGNDSFNNGAGMSHLKTATRFIYTNMPLGASESDKPMLSVEQAYDVAAYVLSLERPNKPGREYDFPNPNFRPDDYPVPAYFPDDEVALEQAKYGPFQ
ncbi:MAG: c-type cytochrome [Campylobacterales bacterium]|nr:c-type cytochrome [Campylobacterales bacterium]